MTSRRSRVLVCIALLGGLCLAIGLVFFSAPRPPPPAAPASAPAATLEFDRVPLNQVVAAFNRQNRIQIAFGSPSLEQMVIGGRFAPDQPQVFVGLLETGFGITSEQKGETITLHPAKLAGSKAEK